MTYFVLEPEAAGTLGDATTGDLRARPPLIEKFNMNLIHGLTTQFSKPSALSLSPIVLRRP